MNIEELRLDSAKKQKRGLHFVLASILVWGTILIINMIPAGILTKNLLSICCVILYLPLARFLSRHIGVKYNNRRNPLTRVSVLFSLNQLLYLPIAFWVAYAVPEKMLMVVAMIFGANLLPFGWLYKSISYYAFSILIPIVSLIIGYNFQPNVLISAMIIMETIFGLCIFFESMNKK